MARRITNGGEMAPGKSRNGNGRTVGNGDGRPALAVKTNEKGQIFSHIRQKWLAETPEERVRQAYVVTLHNEYGFDLEQMDEELHVAGRGSARARADVVIWRTAQDKADSKTPLIVVECKSDNITIQAADYAQGEAYALLKERFDYPIFLYEAEKVGITATGEPDANELHPNDRMPAGVKPEETCVELYRQFVQEPRVFAAEGRHE